MKRIHFLAASDRLNYGDLLYPVLFKRIFREDLLSSQFYNYGVVRSDFSEFKALPTFSYRDLVNNIKDQDDIVVVGGGGVLFPSWQKLLSFISPAYATLLELKLFSRLEKRCNLARRMLSKDRSISPFLPDVRARLIYNSVGGHFPSKLSSADQDAVVRKLNEADYISVRDRRTKESLERNNIENVNMSPDSATIISDFYKLDGNLRDDISEQVKSFANYVFFQVGRFKGPGDIRILSATFQRLKRLGYRILCSPIATAPGHEDDRILKEIVKLFSDCTYYEPRNIFETMFLIGNSAVYMGTSLHGAITAFSYGKCVIPLNKKVKKLDGYCHTWWNTITDGCVGFEDLEDSVESRISGWDYENSHELLKKQKALVYDNCEKMGAA